MKATVSKGRFILIACLWLAVCAGAGSGLSHPGASAASPAASVTAPYSTPSGVPWG
jgi:hypothetical protein